MKRLLVWKPMLGLAALLLIVQLACVASSISPTTAPGAGGAGSYKSTQPASGSQATQPSSYGSQSTQSAPLGGAQNTQTAPQSGGQSTQASPSSGGSYSTQAAPTASGQSTQSVPSTGGQATQSVPSTGGRGMPAGAQALLSQVAQHYQSAGRQQALKDFTDQRAPFNAPGMFVLCIGADHEVSAMGGFPMLVGFSADNIPEVTGRSMGNVIWGAATANPQGSVPFVWKNPLTGTVESKILVYQKLSQDVCGVVANQL